MLDRGWSVFATDAQQEAIDRLRARAGDRPNLRVVRSPMEDVELPPAELVWASFSLFFCDPARFPDVWDRIVAAVAPAGLFAGHFLGERDTWAADPTKSSFTRPDVEALFAGWAIERFDVEDEDGEAWSAPKHWHVYEVVARKPAAAPA